MRCLRRILDIKWLDKVKNNEVFARTGLSRLYTLLQQCRLRWLGHVSRMPDGRIPKDLLYGELASGSRAQGRPHLSFKDACKRDMKALELDPNNWEQVAADINNWRKELHQGLQTGETKLQQEAIDKRALRKGRQTTCPIKPSTFKFTHCDRDCHSQVGLYSHSRSCLSAN